RAEVVLLRAASYVNDLGLLAEQVDEQTGELLGNFPQAFSHLGLVLAAHALGVTNSVVAGACIVYFWARVVHALAYTFAVPWVRTLAFTVGFFAQAVIAWQILSR
ncbi:MAG: MAPEG family protein, partial [Burkholderiaceae bacterium]